METQNLNTEGYYKFKSSSLSNKTGRGTGTTMEIDSDTTASFATALTMGSNGKLFPAIGSDSTSIPCLFLNIEEGTGNKEVLFKGFIRNDAWNWSLGRGSNNLIYLSTTSEGGLTQSPTQNTGDQIQIVGFAISSNIMFFNPDYTWVEIA